jgi:hypothetical protein
MRLSSNSNTAKKKKFALDQCCSVELLARMKMFCVYSAQYDSHWPHVVIQHLSWGKFNWGNYLFFFGSTGASTQGLTLTSQLLYYLAHDPNPFCFRYFFERGSHFSRGWPGPWFSYLCFPYVAGMMVCATSSAFISWDGGHTNFLPRLDSIAILLILASQVARIIDLSHWAQQEIKF